MESLTPTAPADTLATQIAAHIIHDAVQNSTNGSWCKYFHTIQKVFPDWKPTKENLDALELALYQHDELCEVCGIMDDCIDVQLYTSYLVNYDNEWDEED